MHRHSFAGLPGLGCGSGNGRYGGVPLGNYSGGRELVYCTVGLTPEAMHTYQFKADTLDAYPGTLVASLAGLEVSCRQVLPVWSGAAVLSSDGAHVLLPMGDACTSGPAFPASARVCAVTACGEERREVCRVWQRGAVDRAVTLTFRRCPELFHRLHDYMWCATASPSSQAAD